jgi:hypothetical protein
LQVLERSNGEAVALIIEGPGGFRVVVVVVILGVTRALVVQHVGHGDEAVSLVAVDDEAKDTGNDGHSGPNEFLGRVVPEVRNMLTDIFIFCKQVLLSIGNLFQREGAAKILEFVLLRKEGKNGRKEERKEGRKERKKEK